MDYSKCPNCGKSIGGLLGGVLIEQHKVAFINKHTNASQPAYCTSCSPKLIIGITDRFKQQRSQIENRLQQIIHHIPVLTSPAPIKWEYEVIGMVNAQSTAGTGFVTELSRSFNDFFGSGSNATNQKIAKATAWCKADLRVQCARNGGNAIISTDIDFSEIGSGSTNMLMVCMAGTAIQVTDVTYLNAKSRDAIIEIAELTEQLEAIIESAK